jgi:hypothetical protein
LRHTIEPEDNMELRDNVAAHATELQSLNVDDLDVEELEQRLEMATTPDCDCTWNDCSSYCNAAVK